MLLTTGTIAHTLVTSVRRRRRELAILTTAGFVPGRYGRPPGLDRFANQTAIEPVPVISRLKPPCTPSLPAC
jgi:hypothetical protein